MRLVEFDGVWFAPDAVVAVTTDWGGEIATVWLHGGHSFRFTIAGKSESAGRLYGALLALIDPSLLVTGTRDESVIQR